jgi:hypothetical protein
MIPGALLAEGVRIMEWLRVGAAWSFPAAGRRYGMELAEARIL